MGVEPLICWQLQKTGRTGHCTLLFMTKFVYILHGAEKLVCRFLFCLNDIRQVVLELSPKSIIWLWVYISWILEMGLQLCLCESVASFLCIYMTV